MVRQGFLGALEQYWDVQPKPRLERKNSWFRDNTHIEPVTINIILYVSVIASLLFVVLLCLGTWMGAMLL